MPRPRLPIAHCRVPQPIQPRPVKKMRRLDNIDLRLLRVFVAVVEAHGFSEAQFALNLSASTLSTHLAALERNLGGRLCDRGRGGFRLTPFGEATYKATRQLFSELDSFDQ